MINLEQPAQLYNDKGSALNRSQQKAVLEAAARQALYEQQRRTAAADVFDDNVIALALHRALASSHHAMAARKDRTEDNPTIGRILRDPELLDMWMPCILIEIQGLIDVGALEECSAEEALTPGFELLPNIIQLKRKRNPDRTVKKMKARLCMNGKIELHDFGMFADRDANYSPNANFDTILQLLSFSVRRGWNICGLDVTMAYVMADYKRPQPLYTYIDFPDQDRKYYRVKKMIYGLPDAGRAWYDTLTDFLVTDMGYHKSIYDPCLFVKIQGEEDGIAIAVTTDDCLISHSNNDAGKLHLADLLECMTQKNWKYTFDPVVHDMLGIQFNWLEEIPGALLLRLPSKIQDIKEYFFPGVSDDNIPKYFDPFPAWWTPEKSVISATNPAIDATKYRKGIGLVPYNTKTRNDIRVAFCFLATKMQTPSQLDYDALKHLAAYLWTTRDIGLCFHPASSVNGNTDTILLSATDGSWDPQLEDSASVLGTLHKIGAIDDPSAPIAASTNKERGACSMSATVCEAKALLQGTDRVIVYRGIAADLGRPQDLPTIMIQDNSGVMATLLHVTPKAGMKGERRMWSHLKGRIAELTIKMQQNGTKEQPADPLTKRQTVMQNLRSLPTLQGQQPQIARLFELHAEHKPSRRPSQTAATVAAAISSDGFPQLPYHLLEDDTDDVEASIRIAQNNRTQQESTSAVPSHSAVDRILFVETNRHTYYELADTPYPRRASLKSVSINLNNNIFYDHVDIA